MAMKRYAPRATRTASISEEQIASAPINLNLVQIVKGGLVEKERVFVDKTADFKELGAIQKLEIKKVQDTKTLQFRNRVRIKFANLDTDCANFSLYGIKRDGKRLTIAPVTITDAKKLSLLKLGICTKGEGGEPVTNNMEDGIDESGNISVSKDAQLYVDISALGIVA